jgi:hypothetical protein
LGGIGKVWKKVHALESDINRFAKASDGLDRRRIRKQIFSAIGADIKTAKDPNKVTSGQIESAFREARKILKEMEQ